MERRQLQFFLAIADAGSLTRAAARLGVAQPSLSSAMRTLERELGTQLLERHGRGVRLTAAGQALTGPARRTLRSFDLAAGAVRAAGEEAGGRLSIVSNTLWTLSPLVEVLAQLRRLHPRSQFVVTDPASRADVVDQVRTGAADLGLLDGSPPGGSLESLWLADHELVAVLPPGREPPGQALGQPLGQPLGVADLVPLGLVATPRGTPMRTLLDEQLEAAGEPTEVSVETAHVAAVLPLVLAGAGVAVLPEGMAADAAAKGARLARLRPPVRASIWLVWRRGRLGGLGEQLVLVAGELRSDGGASRERSPAPDSSP